MENVEILSAVDILDAEGNLAKAGTYISNLMRVRFKLCHANVNANYDEFIYEELLKGYKTSAKQAIAFKHPDKYDKYGQHVIGSIDKVYFIDVNTNKVFSWNGDEESTNEFDSKILSKSYGKKESETSYVLAEGVVWKDRFPDEAEKMYSDYNKGELFFSMECRFSAAKCSVCEQTFASSELYCEHLKNRYYNGTSRQLLGINFRGAARVPNPADKEAEALLAASKRGFKLIDIIKDENFNDKLTGIFLEAMIGA